MSTTNLPKDILPFEHGEIQGFLDFNPLYEKWDELVKADGNDSLYYKDLKERLQTFPDLLKSPVNMDDLKNDRNQLGFSLLMSSLFPMSGQEKTRVYGISAPFVFDSVYATEAYKSYFMKPDGTMRIPENLDLKQMATTKLLHVYSLILEQTYGIKLNPIRPFIYKAESEDGLAKFFQITINTDFVKVVPKSSLPEYDPDSELCTKTSLNQFDLEQWMKWLPIENFEFHGFAIMEAQDVTQSQSMAVLNEALLRQEEIGPKEFMSLVDQSVKGLLDRPDIYVGLAFLQKINGKLILSVNRLAHSHIIRFLCETLGEDSFDSISEFISKIQEPVFLNDLTGDNLEYKLLREVGTMGIQEVILYPLKHKGRTLGLLEVCSPSRESFDPSMMNSLDYLAPSLSMGLDRQAEGLEKRIDTIIKRNFTAIHPVVGWKFEDIALDYALSQDKGETPEIKPIVFKDVYPLYAAVDIRNSSTERNRAIQDDILAQLELGKSILEKAKELVFLPLLDRLIEKAETFMERINLIMVSDEEVKVTSFFSQELEPTFRHLADLNKDLKKPVDDYFNKIDPTLNVISTSRTKFEKSLEYISNSVTRYLETQEETIQKVFPHYFEKFKTDGVEYNMYIGQSLVNKQKFDPLYLKNLRLWQIQSMIDIIHLMESEKENLEVDLDTTQLILSHSSPISISFRLDERKFDVEGAYNIRYEVIKKRIDKARILKTGERLTQPRKIAIVYSHSKEAAEYLDYISYFQHKGLLAPEIEEVELEEMQGVYGLKALRVSVMPEEKKSSKKKSKAISDRKEG